MLKLEEYHRLEYLAGNPIKPVKCPNCNYGGGDPDIGTSPISMKMMCLKCRRYFYPFRKEALFG